MTVVGAVTASALAVRPTTPAASVGIDFSPPDGDEPFQDLWWQFRRIEVAGEPDGGTHLG